MTASPAPESPGSLWWQIFLAEIDKLPKREQPERLAALAQELIARRENGTAVQLMLRALRLLKQTGMAGSTKFRSILRAMTSGYHLQISTDQKRIAAWEAALATVIQPGMLVLEIGTGTGILAMLAARAGAEVVTCDSDILIAAMAEETIRENGLAGRIRVVPKSIDGLQIPQDLPRPADLLILDLFSDRLFDFNPFEAIAKSHRLLRQDAAAVPMCVSLECALANYKRWSRIMPGQVNGIDLRGFMVLGAPHVGIDAADQDLSLQSSSECMVRAQPPFHLLPPMGVSEKILTSNGGSVNGLAIWIRLDLALGHVLEARPGTVPTGFYAKPKFYPFRECFQTSPGERYHVRLNWEGTSIWVEPVEALAKSDL